MCDYSLHAFPNRLAVEGEELMVHRFGGGSLGLASAADVALPAIVETTPSRGWWKAIKSWFDPGVRMSKRVCAVCIPPGARLELRESNSVKAAVFTQTTPATNTYRDAVRFGDGKVMLLQSLPEGLRVKVLDLSSAADLNPDALHPDAESVLR